MITDPTVTVICDTCGYAEDFGLTATARRGYDERNLKSDLEASGWETVSDNVHKCSECVREEARCSST